MSFELRAHTADVAVEATADSLGAVMAAIADGMAAAMTDEAPEGGQRHDLSVTAESREALLFDYLDELIYERDVRELLPVDNRATVTPPDGHGKEGAARGADGVRWQLEGSYRGVPLAGLGARDLKAVTYSEMAIEETANGWRAYVVFDV